MSWRIATDAGANTDGAADFTIGVDGTIEDCIDKSWGESPIKVRSTDETPLRDFISAWCVSRDCDKIWKFYKLSGGKVTQIGPDHPSSEELLAAIKDRWHEERAAVSV